MYIYIYIGAIHGLYRAGFGVRGFKTMCLELGE